MVVNFYLTIRYMDKSAWCTTFLLRNDLNRWDQGMALFLGCCPGAQIICCSNWCQKNAA